MRSRQFPEAWLFADARLGEAIWPALARLPRGSGVVLHGHPAAKRIVQVARRRGLVVVDRVAKAHDRTELVRARRSGAPLVFVSPVFATRTHPAAPALGPVRLGLLIRNAGVPVAALGGMTARRYRQLRRLGIEAWGAIDAFAGDQKLNAVPR